MHMAVLVSADTAKHSDAFDAPWDLDHQTCPKDFASHLGEVQLTEQPASLATGSLGEHAALLGGSAGCCVQCMPVQAQFKRLQMAAVEYTTVSSVISQLKLRCTLQLSQNTTSAALVFLPVMTPA